MSRHVLILGGHGQISQLLTPLLLARAWTVTSVIRTRDQEDAIKALGAGRKGKLNVLVRSLEDVREQSQAMAILNEAKPDYVVWSAGAGGKGAPERTFLIDRDAAAHFVRAAAAPSSPVTRFLLVSYVGSRRRQPAWWNDAAWDEAQRANREVLASYYEAKIQADEVLYRESRQGVDREKDFVGIGLRPGTLTSEPEGRVELGRTARSRGRASRASVARVADLLLAAEGIASCWLDLLDGDEDAAAAVDRVVREGVDAAEGEPVHEEK